MPKAKMVAESRNGRFHPTKVYCLKQAPVDVGIYPVVEWLNSFNEINTLFACEGDEDCKRFHSGYQHPYVVFVCRSQAVLIGVLHILSGAATCDVDFREEYGTLRYTIRFIDKTAMKNFVKTLRGK